jgi:hypothetical protein
MAKKADLFKAKQKRQKIIAGVLGVLFVGLLAFQVPRVLKQLNPPAPPTPASSTTTTPSGTPSLAAPTLQGGSQGPATTPTPGASALATGTATVQDGQLTSFSRFTSKDPFAQQLSEHGSSSAPSSSPSGGSSGSGGSSPSPGASKPGSNPSPGSAVISVNGTLYTVAVGSDFPNNPGVVPLFHLVSLTAHTARISIAGGSYANGAPTVTLKENKPVTLMNTADGTRYKLVLKPQGTGVGGSAGGGGTTTSPTVTTTTSPTVTIPPSAP